MRSYNPRRDPNSDEFDARDVVEHHWTHDYTQNRLRSTMQSADELLRLACHATLNAPREVLVWPSDVASVVGNLAGMCAKADQLLDQVGDELIRKAQRGELYHDGIDHRTRWLPEGVAYAQGAATGAHLAMNQARALFGQAVAALQEAARPLSHLGTLDEDERPEDLAPATVPDVEAAAADRPALQVVRDNSHGYEKGQ